MRTRNQPAADAARLARHTKSTYILVAYHPTKKHGDLAVYSRFYREEDSAPGRGGATIYNDPNRLELDRDIPEKIKKGKK